VKRQVDYTWRLAELMAAHSMHNSTDLIPRLAERGIVLSRPQIYRVVHQRPKRISLQMLAALCDIFSCGVEDLVHRDRQTWKRSLKVQDLLTGLSSGRIPLTHDGLDDLGGGRLVGHLRSMLEHHGLLPPRDEHLARFESWLAAKLEAIPQPSVRRPVEQFATWHHLNRLRRNSMPGQSSDGPVRSPKQEITETIKFLTWLNETHHRTAATCNQHDVDEYLVSGPTTRHLIRTFFVWAKANKINKSVQIAHRQAKTTRILTQDQRLA
jgi:DNA-binding Xre family transcriptional regulator